MEGGEAMAVVTCAGCGEDFEARRATAKWCSDRCRKATRRRSPEPASDTSPPAEHDTGLVDSVRRELDRADRLDTYPGQLALQLARRLSNPEESGISGLSKELRTVMTAALEGTAPPPSEDEDDNEVARARRAREEKGKAAAAATGG
jgi:hypothetical protein